jgi:ABC-2 type transport system permease protein
VSTQRLRARRPMTFVVQTLGMLRKEVVEILRQPRLIVTLVLGPFLLLLLFGNSYDENRTRLLTMFVVPPGGAYEQAIDEHAESLEEYIDIAGRTDDRAAAEELLRRREVDLVVVFPDDAAERVLAGEQAVITVLNDKIDPLQRSSVEVASRLAVQEMNAAIVAAVVARAQEGVEPADVLLDDAFDAGRSMSSAAASDDSTAMEASARRLERHLDDLQRVARANHDAIAQLGGNGGEQRQAELDRVEARIAALRDTVGSIGAPGGRPAELRERSADVNRELESLRPLVEALATVDPDVLIRPFTSDTYTILPQRIRVTDFFSPSSIALLLQHLALSAAALALVKDRSLGLLELFRVGPSSVVAILAGRFLAFAAIGSLVAVALVLGVMHGLDTPMLGSYWWLAAAILLLLLASVALGMIVALFSRSDSQAVQYAMLVLLASLFFGGFVLDLDLFEYPARAISWILPVTYGIRMLQDVMLRGVDPAAADVLAISVQGVAFAVVAGLLFRRRVAVQ